ncbi:hypothetical protein KXW25_006312 [Aspergillus fumigatus]|nr:hypothetical protein KXX14_006113 [Aspergillus fumigatus]KAH1669945.1 hypothetical protein KXX65_008034 [Aspergillus fumigatus]KAH1814502.1 hypothetical protein KXX19_004467 [Aspergillus fumigatus]KAH2079485.1 hypothetical protein KXX03_005047 [Aspergillus fumigatus]KAH2236189.1 hypothetical protein KXW71_005186 [Aspergillus fumigatus]
MRRPPGLDFPPALNPDRGTRPIESCWPGLYQLQHVPDIVERSGEGMFGYRALVVDAKCADNEAAAAGVHRDWRGLVGLELL